CGFCGRNNTCQTNIQQSPKTAKVIRVTSNCPYRDKFLTFAVSPRSSKSNPCTNRPIQCVRC
ncbi:hypothetical protein BDV93DRAFT_395725, partial [Ceratobasidium sp. AG-I]